MIFEGVLVGRARIDLVIARQIILELKSVDQLRDIHFVQLRSYLRAARAATKLQFSHIDD
jgi:GxxExxY protein